MDLKGAEIRNIYELCQDMKEKHDSTKLHINIPYYQRPYLWDKDHITKLITDYFRNCDENGKEQQQYFVGSIVTVKGENKEYHDVIDGQQRITTVFLLNYLNFLLLRSYIEEALVCRHVIGLDKYLEKFKRSYCSLIGKNKEKIFDELLELPGDLSKLMQGMLSGNVSESEKKEIDFKVNKKIDFYREKMCIPSKDFSDINKYQKKYQNGLKKFFSNETLRFKYSRDSYNAKLMEVLCGVFVRVSSDNNPELYVSESLEQMDGQSKNRYIEALKYEFKILKDKCVEGETPLENAVNMISTIDNMLENLNFCVIMTGNENDAYTLFEVLNDRALEVDDLDLVKNMFFKKYCLSSKDSDYLVDKNVEELDRIWGEEIFNRNGVNRKKLIAYLGTMYLTADEKININREERFREPIEKEYLNKEYYGEKKYKYINILNDFRIFQMMGKIIDKSNLAFNKAADACIQAECNNSVSKVYKTFHLLHAEKLKGVMTALTNIIVKTFVDQYADCGREKIDIHKFEIFLDELLKSGAEKNEEYKEICQCSELLWKVVLMAKNYQIPREIARKIVRNISRNSYNTDCLKITKEDNDSLQKEFVEWTEQWKYKSSNDLKIKVLFINLYGLDKEGSKLKIKATERKISTNKIHLDHLEANNCENSFRNLYFQPEKENDERSNYVDSLGNFMILDGEDNNFKGNKPLFYALDYHRAMGDHWLINEIEDLMEDDKYSKCINVDNKEVRIPKEEFFYERKKKLKSYFYALLQLDSNNMEIEIKEL